MVDANIPNVSGLLMALPEIYRERKAASERKEILANLKIDDNESLMQTSRRLLATGIPENMKLAMQIDQMVRANREQELDLANSRDIQSGIAGAVQPAAPAAPQPPIQGPYPLPRADSPPTPAVGASPAMMRPTAQPEARQEVTPSATVWGDREAEAAGLYDPLPGRAAAPPPASVVTPSGEAVAQRPIPVVGSPETTRPPIQVAQARPQLAETPLSSPSPEERAIDARLQWAITHQARIKSTGRGAKALDTYIGNLQKEKETYVKQRLERERSELETAASATKKETEGHITEIAEARKLWRGKAQNAQNSDNSLNLLDKLLDDPRVLTGQGSENVARLSGALLTANKIAAAIGLPHYSDKEMSGMSDPLKKREAIGSLTAQITLSRMGSLGAGFSNADRDFTVSQVPSLNNSVEGNKALVEINKAFNKREKDIHKIVSEYKGRDVGELDRRIAEYSEKNALFVKQNGEATELGRKVIELQKPKSGNPGGGFTGFIKRQLDALEEGDAAGAKGKPRPNYQPGNVFPWSR